jgi:AcrR family transcriptional regulator
MSATSSAEVIHRGGRLPSGSTASLIGRSTWLIGARTAIGHPSSKCENSCFLILHLPLMRVKMTGVAQVRPYRGVEAAERLARRRRRFLEAGLDLLGGDTAEAELTVRGICGQAGVALRYFYESFADKDDLVAALFDWVIADIAATTQAAVMAAPVNEQSRAGMANIVRVIAADTRVGRLLFSSQLSNAVVARKRTESFALMATLTFQHAGTMGARNDDRVRAASHFVVGGVTQMLTAWLAGDIALNTDDLVDQLAGMIDALAVPDLYHS